MNDNPMTALGPMPTSAVGGAIAATAITVHAGSVNMQQQNSGCVLDS